MIALPLPRILVSISMPLFWCITIFYKIEVNVINDIMETHTPGITRNGY